MMNDTEVEVEDAKKRSPEEQAREKVFDKDVAVLVSSSQTANVWTLQQHTLHVPFTMFCFLYSIICIIPYVSSCFSFRTNLKRGGS
jgi:hypothetical protein